MRLEIHAVATGSRARVATLVTSHDRVETPVFMPVGTRATVRTQTRAQLERLGAPILLANTYHLLVRPGLDVFERFGGLHRWMGWTHSILTDSALSPLWEFEVADTMTRSTGSASSVRRRASR